MISLSDPLDFKTIIGEFALADSFVDTRSGFRKHVSEDWHIDVYPTGSRGFSIDVSHYSSYGVASSRTNVWNNHLSFFKEITRPFAPPDVHDVYMSFVLRLLIRIGYDMEVIAEEFGLSAHEAAIYQ